MELLLQDSDDKLNNASLTQAAESISLLPQQSLTSVSRITTLLAQGAHLRKDLSRNEVEYLGEISNKVHSAYSIPIIYMPLLEQHQHFADLPGFTFEEKIQGYVNYAEGKFFISEFAVHESWSNFYELASSIKAVLQNDSSIKIFEESFEQLMNSRSFKTLSKRYRETYRNSTLKFNRNSFVVKDYRVELYCEMQSLFEGFLLGNNLEKSKVEIIKTKLDYKGNV